MEEEEREVYLNQLTAEERSKNIKLTEKHCRQMMDLIYKKKMDYFKSGGDDWKEVLERSYPRDPPNVEPPPYNKGDFTSYTKIFGRYFQAETSDNVRCCSSNSSLKFRWISSNKTSSFFPTKKWFMKTIIIFLKWLMMMPSG